MQSKGKKKKNHIFNCWKLLLYNHMSQDINRQLKGQEVEYMSTPANGQVTVKEIKNLITDLQLLTNTHHISTDV